MFLGSLARALRDGDALPSELLYGNEGLLQVRVFRDEVRAEMEGETLRNQDIRRRFGDVCVANRKVGLVEPASRWKGERFGYNK